MRIATTLLLLLLSYPGFSQNADPITAGNFPAADLGRQTLGEAAAPDFLPVEEAYQLALEIIDDQQLRLYWRITDGYYLYRHHQRGPARSHDPLQPSVWAERPVPG